MSRRGGTRKDGANNREIIHYSQFSPDGTSVFLGTSRGIRAFDVSGITDDRPRKENAPACNEEVFVVSQIGRIWAYSPISRERLIFQSSNNDEILSRRSESDPILNILHTTRYILVVFASSVHVYPLMGLFENDHVAIETAHHNGQLVAAAADFSKNIIACPHPMPPDEPQFRNSHHLPHVPGRHQDSGYVAIYKLNQLETNKRPFTFRAHKNPLASIALSHDGTKIATASTYGTIIYVFDTTTGTKLHGIRRGLNQADISCMAFSRPLSSSIYVLAAASSNGTVHIFDVSKLFQTEARLERIMWSSVEGDEISESPSAARKKSGSGWMSWVPNPRNVAQGLASAIVQVAGVQTDLARANALIKVNLHKQDGYDGLPEIGTRLSVAFAGPHHIMVLTSTGELFLYQFELGKWDEPKEVTRETYNYNLLQD